MANNEKKPNNGKEPENKLQARKFPMDPNPVVIQGVEKQLPDLGNQKLETLVEAYAKSSNPVDLQALVEVLRDSLVFVPGKMELNKTVTANILHAGEKLSYLPIYTSAKHIGDKSPFITNLLALPYPAANDLAVNLRSPNQPLDGIVINPVTNNIRFTNKLIDMIQEAEKERKATGVKKTVDLGIKKAELPEIKNEEVEELVAAFKEETDLQNRTLILNKILNGLYQKNVVICVGKDDKGNVAPELMIHNETKKQFLPVYTNPQVAIKPGTTKNFSVLPFDKIVDLAVKTLPMIEGIMLMAPNGMLTMERNVLDKINEVNTRRAEAEKKGLSAAEAQGDQAEANDPMTDMAEILKAGSQNPAFAHQYFELYYLPNKIREAGETLIDEIIERKEERIDELFEESYYDIRMYPYLVEEFTVSIITCVNDVDVITIEFPKRDQGIGCAVTSYIAWDRINQKGRYFSIIRGAKGLELSEQTEEGDVKLGEAPAEGSILSAIIDLINGSVSLGSEE